MVKRVIALGMDLKEKEGSYEVVVLVGNSIDSMGKLIEFEMDSIRELKEFLAKSELRFFNDYIPDVDMAGFLCILEVEDGLLLGLCCQKIRQRAVI